MSDIRRRKVDPDAPKTSDDAPSRRIADLEAAESPKISVVDILRIALGLFLVNGALSYYITGQSLTWNYRPWYIKPAQIRSYFSGPLRLTDEQLKAYDGSDATKPVYLALNGTIYDVSANRKTYGPDGSYGFFSGRDATRAFVTGCFDTDLTPDMRGVEEMYMPIDDEDELATLSTGQIKTRREQDLRVARKKMDDVIDGWAQMFRGDGGKNYFKVGEVARAPGWLEALPEPTLCGRAKGLRKKRSEKKK